MKYGKSISRLDITEDLIIQEYKHLWLDSIKKKDKVNMLYNHPSLLKSDYDYIDEKVSEYRTKKYMHGIYTTAGLTMIYNLAFKNRWYFYNFFNKQGWTKYGFARKFKKIGMLYVCYVANVQMFSYMYDKTLLHDFQIKGLFEKYNLEFYFNTGVE